MSDMVFIFIAVISLLSEIAFINVTANFLYEEVRKRKSSVFDKLIFTSLVGIVSFQLTFIILISLHKTAKFIVNLKV